MKKKKGYEEGSDSVKNILTLIVGFARTDFHFQLQPTVNVTVFHRGGFLSAWDENIPTVTPYSFVSIGNLTFSS